MGVSALAHRSVEERTDRFEALGCLASRAGKRVQCEATPMNGAVCEHEYTSFDTVASKPSKRQALNTLTKKCDNRARQLVNNAQAGAHRATTMARELC
jgi:hypothetical protein